MLRPGVKRTFLIGTIGILLGTGLAMVLLMRAVLAESLHANHQKRGMFIAANVARDSAGLVLTERYFELQMMLNDLKASADDIAYVFVQADDGEVLAHTFRGGFPEDLRDLHRSGTSGSGLILLDSVQGAIHDYSAALFRGAGGMVHVGLLEAPLKQEVYRAFMLVIGGILAAVLIGSGMAVVLGLAITRPIEDLAVAVGAMGRGELQVRAPVLSNDEVGRLSAAFNSMAERREQAEGALVASEQRLRAITASLGEGLVVVDQEGRVTFMNPEAERLLGWSEPELRGRPFHETVHDRRPDGSPYPADECPSRLVARTGSRATIDDEIYFRKDGSAFHVSFIADPVSDSGKGGGVVIAFQDITVRKQREAERERMIMEHMDALSKVKVLSGMLPICSSCKKIRDDAGYWKQIESYIHEHSEAEFSHGICPDCATKLYPEHFKKNT